MERENFRRSSFVEHLFVTDRPRFGSVGCPIGGEWENHYPKSLGGVSSQLICSTAFPFNNTLNRRGVSVPESFSYKTTICPLAIATNKNASFLGLQEWHQAYPRIIDINSARDDASLRNTPSRLDVTMTEFCF